MKQTILILIGLILMTGMVNAISIEPTIFSANLYPAESQSFNFNISNNDNQNYIVNISLINEDNNITCLFADLSNFKSISIDNNTILQDNFTLQVNADSELGTHKCNLKYEYEDGIITQPSTPSSSSSGGGGSSYQNTIQGSSMSIYLDGMKSNEITLKGNYLTLFGYEIPSANGNQVTIKEFKESDSIISFTFETKQKEWTKAYFIFKLPKTNFKDVRNIKARHIKNDGQIEVLNAEYYGLGKDGYYFKVNTKSFSKFIIYEQSSTGNTGVKPIIDSHPIEQPKEQQKEVEIPQNSVIEPQKPSNNKVWSYVILICLIVGFISLLGYYYFTRKKGDNGETN